MLSRAVVGVVLGAAFGFLAALHVFWAFGGTWGAGAAVAEIDGRPRFAPSRGATLAVAAALIGAAVVVLVTADLILGFMPRWASQWAAGLLGAVFVLRALGDFPPDRILQISEEHPVCGAGHVALLAAVPASRARGVVVGVWVAAGAGDGGSCRGH
jgi:hypothetical protein